MCVGEVRGRGPRERSAGDVRPKEKPQKIKRIPLNFSSSSSHGLHILLIWLLTGLLIWLLIWLLIFLLIWLLIWPGVRSSGPGARALGPGPRGPGCCTSAGGQNRSIFGPPESSAVVLNSLIDRLL